MHAIPYCSEKEALNTAIFSHFGLIIKVQLVKLPDADEVLVNFEGLRNFKRL